MTPASSVSRILQSPVAAAALAAAAGLLVLAAGLAAAGYDPVSALGALWRGAFGSWYALTSATLVRATPLIVLGIGFALAMQAGALNIGAEGQFYAGAIAATWVALHLTGVPRLIAVPVVLASGAVAGALWILGPVVLRLRFGVLEVISTLLLNFVAEALVSLMVQGPLQEAKHIYPQSDLIPASARLPLMPGSRLHLGLALALVLGVLAWVVIRRTRWGFALRAAGAGPRAAEVIGRIRVPKTLAIGLLISGSLAGLGGAIEVTGVTYALFQNLSPGYGFQAIAVALLARLNPLAIVVTGLLFGALQAGAGGMQREAGVPAVAVEVVQAVVIVVTLLSVATSARAAAAAAPEPT